MLSIGSREDVAWMIVLGSNYQSALEYAFQLAEHERVMLAIMEEELHR